MTADEALKAVANAVADLRAGVERDAAGEVFVPQRLVLAVQDACDGLLSARTDPTSGNTEETPC